MPEVSRDVGVCLGSDLEVGQQTGSLSLGHGDDCSADRGSNGLDGPGQAIRELGGELHPYHPAITGVRDTARPACRDQAIHQTTHRAGGQGQSLSQLAAGHRAVDVEQVRRLEVSPSQADLGRGDDVELDDGGQVAAIGLGEVRSADRGLLFRFHCTHATIDLMQEDTIQASFDRMTGAWAAGNADAFAAEFTEDASYVIYVGLTYFGRPAIHAAHVPVFQKWQKGTRLSMTILDTRFVGNDVAVVTTEGGIGKGRTIRHDKVQTFLMVKTDQGWQCAAFQNTKKNNLFIAANRWTERRTR